MRNVRIDLRAADQPTGASRDESEVERPKGLVRLGEIPNESQGFQPRDYLLEPLRSVGSAQGTAVVRALVGPRGVGKTQLAAAYARECLVQRWPVVAWIALEDPGQLVAGLAELGERLGLRGADDDAEATARAVRMWLQDDPGLNLVVIDSVENVDEVAPWLPAGGTARIVITTTSQAVANLAEALSVDVFSIEESVAYLARQSGVAGWEEDAKALAEELGRLPLALGQAAWVIRIQGKTYAEYLAALRSTPVDRLLKPVPGSSYPRGLAEAVLLSVQACEQRDGSGMTRRILECAAVLSPIGIPRDILRAAVTRGASNRVDDRYDSAIGALVEPSLMTFSVDKDAVLMHRLVQRVLDDRARRHRRMVPTAASVVAVLAGLRFPHSEAWVRRDIGSALVDQIVTVSAAISAEVTTAWAQRKWLRRHRIWRPFLKAQDLRTWAVEHLIATGDFTRGIALSKVLLADDERLLGPGHPMVLTLLHQLAARFQEAGRLNDAILLKEQTLHGAERTFGLHDERTLIARNSLAVGYQEAERFSEAIALLERNVADSELRFGPDSRRTASARSSLANLYCEAGRLREAISLQEQAAADLERALGPDDLEVLISHDDLAVAYREANRLRKAISLHEQTTADFERVLRRNHPSILVSRNHLAIAYREAGRLKEAVALLKQTVADRERLLGPNHPDVFRSQHELALVYCKAGRLKDAVALLEQTVADRERVLEPDHPDTLTSRDKLAVAYRKVGRIKEAILLHEQVLADRERRFGPDHHTARATKAHLELALAQQSKIEKTSRTANHPRRRKH